MKRLEDLKIAHWLVLALCVCVTFLMWESARRDSSKVLQEEFDFQVTRTVGRIEKRAQDARLILQGTVGLFSASNEVTRREFRTYIDSLELHKNYPGIKTVAFSKLIPAKDYAKLERLGKIEGTDDAYKIWPAGERDWYAPVLYLEPTSDQNRAVLGYDLYSEPLRRAAMEVARDSGRLAVTDKITLIGNYGSGSQADFLVFSPIYRNGSKIETLEQRRSNLIGWVHFSFRIDDMVGGVTSEKLDQQSESPSLQIFFGETANENVLIFQSESDNERQHTHKNAKFKAVKTIPLSNKVMTVLVHSTPAFEARVNDAKANAILIAGLLGSSLLSLLVWQLLGGRKRAILLARKMNHDLLAREKRYRQMFEDNASIAYILDPENGKIIDANTAAANFWGYSVEELRNMHITDINPSSFDVIKAAMERVKANNATQLEFQHRLKNNEIRDVEIYSSVLTHNNKTVIYCIAHDVTGQNLAEKALRESQKKLEAIIETAMDAVVQYDAEGAVIDWNTHAEKIFGWTRQEAIGMPLVESIIPKQHHNAYLNGMKEFLEDEMGTVRHSQFEIDARHRDGREFPIEVAITTMISSSGKQEYCAFMHDITSRKKSENALRKARIELENRVFERTAELVRTNRRLNSEITERTQAQESLQQSQEMLRQLIAHQDRILENERRRIAREIHDELGQHLLVLRIDVSMLGNAESEHPKLDERIRSILQHIDATMRSVRAIINNLRPSVLDLGLYAALEWQAEEFQRRSGIACELVADDEELEFEDSLATVLFRILQEALTNVLRHAKASLVRIELHRDSGRLIMTITDNGVGMQKTQRNEQKSFGLVGIRERLHILGGELNLESSSNGTVLTVTVPMRS
jgi:PAS domain S-box-containing protein